MADYVFRKQGVPALAFPSSEGASSACLCTLRIRVNEATKQATVVLEFNYVLLKGFDVAQRISLIYNGNMLEPSATTLRHATVAHPQLSHVQRRDGRTLKVLGLVLRDLCIVQCPLSAGNLAPKDGSDARFKHLSSLAKAARVSVIFDYAWIHPNKAAQLLCMVSSSDLAGFPRTDAGRDTDWTIFSPAGNETLPSYNEASLKRTRESDSSSPQPPTPKRPTLADVCPGSPTEKATSIASAPSTRPCSSSPPVSPSNWIQDALENAVAKLLAPAVENAVEKLLPGVVQDALPDVLARLATSPRSSPSLSPSQTTSSSSADSPSLLHKLILKQLTAHSEELKEQVTTEVHEHAGELRDTADVELGEYLNDLRAEFHGFKEDGLSEMQHLFDARLEELKEQADEMVDTVESETSMAYVTAQENLRDLVSESTGLAKELLRVRQKVAGEPSGRTVSAPPGCSSPSSCTGVEKEGAADEA